MKIDTIKLYKAAYIPETSIYDKAYRYLVLKQESIVNKRHLCIQYYYLNNITFIKTTFIYEPGFYKLTYKASEI